MTESDTLHKILEQLTFWRVVMVLIVVSIIRVAKKWFDIRIYLQEVTTKYGGKSYFNFPVGFPSRLQAFKDDSLQWDKQSLRENPKLRLFASHFGTTRMMTLIDPLLIKDFLSDQSRYRKAPALKLFVEFLGKGLVFSEGAVWKKHRKLISETFRFEFIASQIPVISTVAKDLFERELTEAEGKQVNILDLYQRITGELVFQIFFGSDLVDASVGGETPTKYLAKNLNLLFENIFSLEHVLFGVPGVKLRLFKRNRELFKVTNELTRFIIGIINERKKKMMKNESSTPIPLSKDFLGILLEAQRISQGTEDEFTDEEVLHEFITFFVAGMDTTGHLLTMATYFYSTSSDEVKEAVMKEAEFLVKNGDDITPEKLNKVETLGAFLKETLRKASPSPTLFARVALNDHYVGDVKISKGTMINCSFAGNNYNPENYKDPETFNLNRWIPGHPDFETDSSKNPFLFTPFSAGQRNCIGQHLATMEAKIILSIFLTNFKFKIPEDYKMRMAFRFMYGPRDPFLIDVEKRDEKSSEHSFKCK